VVFCFGSGRDDRNATPARAVLQKADTCREGVFTFFASMPMTEGTKK
jgi:hypothetical protein